MTYLEIKIIFTTNRLPPRVLQSDLVIIHKSLSLAFIKTYGRLQRERSSAWVSDLNIEKFENHIIHEFVTSMRIPNIYL